MSRSVELLKKRYLKNIKEHPDLFIGIELEYPIVNLEGKATDGEVVKDLFRYLPSILGFTIEKVDDLGIQFSCLIQSAKIRSCLRLLIRQLSLHSERPNLSKR